MKKQYNKLIRDKIIDILDEKDLDYKITIIEDDKEYLELLFLKLMEEAQEFIDEPNPEELGDLLTVISEITDVMGITPIDLCNSMIDKHKERGGFKKRVFLEWIDK